jgi:hypothetical protein
VSIAQSLETTGFILKPKHSSRSIATAKAVRTFLIPETVRLNFDRLSYRADSELVELHGEALDSTPFFP